MRKLIGISLVALLFLFCFSCSQPPNPTSQSIIGQLQTDVATLKASVTALNSAVTSLQSIPAGASKAQIDNLTAELNSNISKVNTLQSQLNNLDSKVNAIQSPTLTGYAKQTAVDDLRAQVSILATRTAGATGEPPPLTQIQADITLLKSQVATIQTQLIDLQTKVTALQGKDASLESRILALETRLPSTTVAPVSDKVSVVSVDDDEVTVVANAAGTYTVIVTMYGVGDYTNLVVNNGVIGQIFTIEDEKFLYDPFYSYRTVTVTQGSVDVVGSLTAWSTTWNTETMYLHVNSGYFEVDEIVDATHLKLVDPYPNTTHGGYSYDLSTRIQSDSRMIVMTIEKTWAANEGFVISFDGFDAELATATVGVG